MKHARKTTVAGFTLIELMIVVAIIAILSFIAYPSYTQWMAQSRRTDAFNVLSNLSNDLEKFYSECSFYTTNITATTRSCTAPAGGSLGRGALGNTSMNSYYAVAITLPAAGTYRITATAQGKQLPDTACRTIVLDSTGARTSADSSAVATTSCWKK